MLSSPHLFFLIFHAPSVLSSAPIFSKRIFSVSGQRAIRLTPCNSAYFLRYSPVYGGHVRGAKVTAQERKFGHFWPCCPLCTDAKFNFLKCLSKLLTYHVITIFSKVFHFFFPYILQYNMLNSNKSNVIFIFSALYITKYGYYSQLLVHNIQLIFCLCTSCRIPRGVFLWYRKQFPKKNPRQNRRFLYHWFN